MFQSVLTTSGVAKLAHIAMEGHHITASKQYGNFIQCQLHAGGSKTERRTCALLHMPDPQAGGRCKTWQSDAMCAHASWQPYDLSCMYKTLIQLVSDVRAGSRE
jgi:hypothetical protein